MERTLRNRRIASWIFIPLAIALCLFIAVSPAGRRVHAGQPAPPVVKKMELAAVHPGSLYALTLATRDLTQLQGTDSVKVTVNDAQGEIASKYLHPADLDLYLTLRPRAAGPHHRQSHLG